jgi:hypothetical protein
VCRKGWKLNFKQFFSKKEGEKVPREAGSWKEKDTGK